MGGLAFVFFGLREAVMNPFFTHLGVYPSLTGFSDRHAHFHKTQGLLPTAAAAYLTGSAWSYFRRANTVPFAKHGRAGTYATGGITVLQGVFNNLDKLLFFAVRRAGR
ncbi:hypothetical protein JCM8547_008242 [Rhodosporidiobolus lusitaniae]